MTGLSTKQLARMEALYDGAHDCENLPLPSPKESSELPEHIPSLDGLRGVSVLLVIAGHAALYGPDTTRWKLFSMVFLNAEIGVTWFFIISGFLITALLLREQTRASSISLSKFYCRRALRILPPFYALIVVVLLLKFFGGLAIPGQRIWTAASFIYNVVKHPSWGSWWLGHTWSLSVEEQFYLCWPLILVLLGVTRGRIAAIAMILAAPVFRVVLLFGYPQFANQISGLLPSRMDALMLGALAALCSSNPAFVRWIRELPGASIACLAVFTFVISPLLTSRLGNVYAFAAGFTLECVCLLMILLYSVYRPTSRLGRILNAQKLVVIGAMSYDIYLWQQLFITPQNTTFTGLPAINLLFLCGCAFTSYRLIGQPFRALGRKWFR
jgi:peptidoglycan/LPS O-acetylase OafA/YrhL